MANTVGGTIVWNLEADSSQAEKSFSDLTNKAQESGDAIDKAIRDSMKNAEKSTKEATKSIGESMTSLGGSLTNLGRDMSLSITAPVTAFSIAALKYGELGGKFSSVQDSFKSMTQGMGIDTVQFTKAVSNATGNQIDDLTILQGATRGLSLIGKDSFNNFSTDFVKMAELSKKAARATGQDVDYMFNSLVLGISRESKLILDNLGVSIDITNAKKEYAKSLGISSEQLTLAQEKNAVLNATLSQLDATYGNVAISAGGFQGALAQLKTEVTNQSIQLGRELEPMLVDVSKSLIQLGKSIIPQVISIIKSAIIFWSSLSEETQQNIIKFVLLAVTLGPVIVVIGSLISAIGTMITAVTTIGSAIGGFSTILTVLTTVFGLVKAGAIIVGTFIAGISTPVWVVIGVITALIAIGYALYQNWDWVSAKAREFVHILVDNFWFLVGQAYNVKNSVVDAFWNMVHSIRSLAGRIYDSITSPFRDAWREIQNIAQRIKDALDRINPWHRNSPSLVDNIKSGIKEIERQFNSLSYIEIPKLSASYNVQSFADGGYDQPNQQVSRSSTINQYNNIYEQVDLDQAMSDLNFALRMG